MYECPNCASNLRFNIDRQCMFCEACGTTMSPYDVAKESDAEVREDFEVTPRRPMPRAFAVRIRVPALPGSRIPSQRKKRSRDRSIIADKCECFLYIV